MNRKDATTMNLPALAQQAAEYHPLGGAGIFLGISLSSVETSVQILVGVATFVYLGISAYVKWKNRNK